VALVMNSYGRPLEKVKYSAYGVAIEMTNLDYNADGVIDPDDGADFIGAPYDWDLDGDVDNADRTGFATDSSNYSGVVPSRGQVSLASIGNRKGYAGYEFDGLVERYHVRHRVYVPEMGRWTRRDPIGYVDGMSLYHYCNSLSQTFVDPSGLIGGGMTESIADDTADGEADCAPHLTSTEEQGTGEVRRAFVESQPTWYRQSVMVGTARGFASDTHINIKASIKGLVQLWDRAAVIDDLASGTIDIEPSLAIKCYPPSPGDIHIEDIARGIWGEATVIHARWLSLAVGLAYELDPPRGTPSACRTLTVKAKFELSRPLTNLGQQQANLSLTIANATIGYQGTLAFLIPGAQISVGPVIVGTWRWCCKCHG